MQKNIKIILFIVFIFVLSACSHVKTENIIKINGEEIKVEIADTPEKQYEGLSNRESLCADCGMLFKFNDKQIRTFVMRNMKFGLDIIWIDDNIIVGISENLPPEGADYKNRYRSPAPADYVLEVNAGFAEENGIKVNDELRMPNVE